MIRRMHDWLATAAEDRPDAPALRWESERWTFGELEARSNRVAHLLRELGCGRGDRVAFSAPKSPDAYCALLGALKADCIYVPLDPEGPAPRVARILAATEPRCVVAGPRSVGMTLEAVRLAGADGTQIGLLSPIDGADQPGPLAFDASSVATMPATRPPSHAVTTDAAHLLFTSGSTGTPKGVVVTHEMVIAFVEWAVGYLQMSADERVSAHSPLTFDLSTFDTFGAIAAGAELHPVPPKQNLLAPKLVELMRDRELTQWFSVPSVLTYLEAFDVVAENDLPHLKRLIWCGEVLPTPTLRYLMTRLPHVRFTNLYGPTEATIASSYYTVPEVPSSPTEPIPIGSACGGEALHVLDDDLAPCAPDTIGDLYIAGIGLSPGYWRDPEKTAGAFLEGPFEHVAESRLYRTGDLASVDGAGRVVFHGRADTQIKSRGYRIELGEIEAALATVEQLRESAVVAIQRDGFEGSLICCGFAPDTGHEFDAPDVRKLLSKLLPRYMLPARWLRLESLPRTSNGKVDRPTLRASFTQAEEARGGT